MQSGSKIITFSYRVEKSDNFRQFECLSTIKLVQILDCYLVLHEILSLEVNFETQFEDIRAKYDQKRVSYVIKQYFEGKLISKSKRFLRVGNFSIYLQEWGFYCSVLSYRFVPFFVSRI